jgi:hypothetical protein
MDICDMPSAMFPCVSQDGSAPNDELYCLNCVMSGAPANGICPIA